MDQLHTGLPPLRAGAFRASGGAGALASARRFLSWAAPRPRGGGRRGRRLRASRRRRAALRFAPSSPRGSPALGHTSPGTALLDAPSCSVRRDELGEPHLAVLVRRVARRRGRGPRPGTGAGAHASSPGVARGAGPAASSTKSAMSSASQVWQRAPPPGRAPAVRAHEVLDRGSGRPARRGSRSGAPRPCPRRRCGGRARRACTPSAARSAR